MPGGAGGFCATAAPVIANATTAKMERMRAEFTMLLSPSRAVRLSEFLMYTSNALYVVRASSKERSSARPTAM